MMIDDQPPETRKKPSYQGWIRGKWGKVTSFDKIVVSKKTAQKQPTKTQRPNLSRSPLTVKVLWLLVWAVGIRRAGTCHGNMYLGKFAIGGPGRVSDKWVALFIWFLKCISKHMSFKANEHRSSYNDATDANHQFKQTLIVCTSSYGPFKVKTSSEKDQLDFFNESCRGHPVG